MVYQNHRKAGGRWCGKPPCYRGMVRDGVQKPPLGVWATVRENHGGGGEQWCWKTAARSVSHGFGKPCVEGERWWRTTAGQVENGAGEPGPGRRAMVSENQNQVAGQQRKAATIGARTQRFWTALQYCID